MYAADNVMSQTAVQIYTDDYGSVHNLHRSVLSFRRVL